jgi:tetratricopeptide (TPR) repeat protein
VNAKAHRRRLLLWSALPVLLVLLLAAKLLSLGVLADRAASGFAAGNASAVDAAAHGLGVANLVEPHKAPFAAGDAAVLAGDYGTARQLFDQALGMVPAGSGDECLVRVNLVLVIERLGDLRLQAGDPSSALPLFREALATAGQAPEACLSPDAEAGADRRLAEARERLEEKLGAAGRPAGPEDGAGEESPENEPAEMQQSQLDQLQDNSRQAQRERNSGREREEYLDNDNGTVPDRPW